MDVTRKRGPEFSSPGLSGTPARRVAAQALEADSAPEETVLARLSRLPDELQDMVIGYLLLADVLVWQKMNRNFCHRIRVGRLRERAVCRSLGSRFPRGGLTRDNYNRRLRPWLAGFAANPLRPDWPGALFRPETLFCSIVRTLKATPRLVLHRQAAFDLPVTYVQRVYFSPDGAHLLAKVMLVSNGQYRTPVYIFSWDGGLWQQGSPFAGVQGVNALCFAADGQRLAVSDNEQEVRIWDRRRAAGWQQTALLTHATPLVSYELHMQFSPDGDALAIQTMQDELYLWNRDARHQWQPGGFFFLARSWMHRVEFSPDGRWLLIPSHVDASSLCCRHQEGPWELHTLLAAAPGQGVSLVTFRPDSQQLLVHRTDESLAVWHCQQGSWSEQTVIQQPDGIAQAFFTADSQFLVIQSARSAPLLWQQGGRGQWEPVGSLLDPAQCACIRGNTSVHIDPNGRWLIASHDARFCCGQPARRWYRDGSGHWRWRPLEALCGGLLDREWTTASDGQHLAALHYTPSRWSGVQLLGFHGGDWVVKARLPTEYDYYSRIVMDPVCCHLAAVCSNPSRIELLRVQQASQVPASAGR